MRIASGHTEGWRGKSSHRQQHKRSTESHGQFKAKERRNEMEGERMKFRVQNAPRPQQTIPRIRITVANPSF